MTPCERCGRPGVVWAVQTNKPPVNWHSAQRPQISTDYEQRILCINCREYWNAEHIQISAGGESLTFLWLDKLYTSLRYRVGPGFRHDNAYWLMSNQQKSFFEWLCEFHSPMYQYRALDRKFRYAGFEVIESLSVPPDEVWIKAGKHAGKIVNLNTSVHAFMLSQQAPTTRAEPLTQAQKDELIAKLKVVLEMTRIEKAMPVSTDIIVHENNYGVIKEDESCKEDHSSEDSQQE